jgi:hypothetical protein
MEKLMGKKHKANQPIKKVLGSINAHHDTKVTIEHDKYRKTDAWKARVDQAMQEGKGKCILCGSDYGLNVHHIEYSRPYDEEGTDNLCLLCRNCHLKVHDIMRMKGGIGWITRILKNLKLQNGLTVAGTIKRFGHREEPANRSNKPIERIDTTNIDAIREEAKKCHPGGNLEVWLIEVDDSGRTNYHFTYEPIGMAHAGKIAPCRYGGKSYKYLERVA